MSLIMQTVTDITIIATLFLGVIAVALYMNDRFDGG